MKNNLWNRICGVKDKLLVTLGMMAIGFQNKLTAFAIDLDPGFLEEEPTDDVFSEITTTVKDAGASLYQLMIVIGIVGFVVSLILAGLSLAFTKNSNKRGEEKSNLLWIFMGMVIVFGAMAIIGLAKDVGTSIN